MIWKELLCELRWSGCKYNEDQIIFITKDSEGKLIWLERGNDFAGLEHIIANHENDFFQAIGIKKNEIALYLYTAITNGKLVKNVPSKIAGGLDRTYEYDDHYYTFVGLGNNGFIVTAFPVGK